MRRNLIKIVSVVFAIVLTFSATVSAAAATLNADEDCRYADIVIPMAMKDNPFYDDDLIINYSEEYEYYSPDSVHESTPDYVLFAICTNLYGGSEYAFVADNYVVRDNSHSQMPYQSRYGVYIPADNKVYPLSVACSLGVEGIENVFTQAGVGELIGDVDKDKKITIKDATCIQKCLAQIAEIENDEIMAYRYHSNPPVKYISDFNRDGQRDIKDVTAIQKYIAGIAE